MFSLVTYSWALAVALPSAEIETIVNEVVAAEDEGLVDMPAI